MRLLAHVDGYDQVVELTKGHAENVAIGDPMAPTTFEGRVATEGASCDRSGSREGARLVAGGERLGDDLSEGYVNRHHGVRGRAAWDGPQRERALPTRRCTAWRATTGQRTSCDAHGVATQLEAGNIWINGFMGLPASVPFGGHRQSGFGRLRGREGIREFTRTKNTWRPLDPLSGA